MNNTLSMRIRISRFLSERYQHRERPCYFVDLFLWFVIAIMVAWPLMQLAQAMEWIR